MEIEGIADFFIGYGDGGIGQMIGNIVDPAGGDGGADQKVGEGTDELFFVDEEKQVAVGTASEDLLKLSVKFGARQMVMAMDRLNIGNTSQFFGSNTGKVLNAAAVSRGIGKRRALGRLGFSQKIKRRNRLGAPAAFTL